MKIKIMNKINTKSGLLALLISAVFAGAIFAGPSRSAGINYDDAISAKKEHATEADWQSTIKNRFQYCVEAAQKAIDKGKGSVVAGAPNRSALLP